MELIIGAVLGVITGVFIGRFFLLRRRVKEYHKLFNELAATDRDLRSRISILVERVAILEMGVDESELAERRSRLYFERV